MEKVSVIIPNSEREEVLKPCVRSILHSAAVCGLGLDSFELVVCQPYEGLDLGEPVQTTLVVDREHPKLFNKPRLLNRGIESSQGSIIAFLDADMLVGPTWLCATLRMPPVTRLCYRVRQLRLAQLEGPANVATVVDAMLRPGWDGWLEARFGEYGRYTLGFEARGRPEGGGQPYGTLFGNSQWAIRRDVLGDLRFDEAFGGACCEDLDMLDAIACRYGAAYTAALADGRDALLHVWHEGWPTSASRAWKEAMVMEANRQRYFRKKAQRRAGRQRRRP